MERVLGVDACKGGWIGIVLADGLVSARVAATIGELIEANGPFAAIAIDMPIGLADDSWRAADLLARGKVGTLWPSVFMTPIRSAFEADNHAAANAINVQVTSKGIAIQAFGLRLKLLEVDAWVKANPDRAVESHPEVSFALMAGAPLTVSKHTWAGAQVRRQLLADQGIELDGDLGDTGSAAVDDVLDAAACAWTARRVARHEARSLPDPPQTFSDGIPCAIWS